ncbi:class I SAM-dependent methyltransferase [Algoriphagus kandeliae]|uniref:Class I SAM-dependent methyltransferase n=1 Tax=Algoriphagus kandeliae TaxID=2562278 RepID=A0A4Y9QWS9_9BACT|nr:class I SAM-dependent methyltransferase [Algoriphagus kandeliae]TFV95536.1 class I SAM-dependent methyltransferase [Algoriphagus kandeliae]
MASCKFCGGEDLREFIAQEKMLGLGESFVYQECLSCQSLQIKEVPKDLSPYYPSEGYYSFIPLVKSGSLRLFLKKLRMRMFLDLGISWKSPSYGYWLKRIHRKFEDAIADVGCGNGQLLYELHAGGFRNLTGIDPFLSESSQIAPGFKLVKSKLEEVDQKFDVIMMHHSFEHLENPEEELKRCYNSLNPGGRLLIRTPLANCEAWREFGENWVQLDAPRHLIIPSLKGFQSLVSKSGFRLKEVFFDSTGFQFWGSRLYEKGFKLAGQNLADHFSKKELDGFNKKALQYNQEGKGDQVCFFLERVD